MTLSRSARITLLLAIDVIFFLVELIMGYTVGSLALIADSFHMLNDVMSLVVALYAIKLATSSPADSRYSYGWHRAEILAALINGVFLLALCLSISLEAIERFFSLPEISNPKLVVIVGSFGLASNIVGLFLFHEHNHSGHNPNKSSPATITRPKSAGDTVTPSQKSSQPRSRSRSLSQSEFSSLYGHPAATRASLVQTAHEIALARSPSPTAFRHSFPASRHPTEAGGAIPASNNLTRAESGRSVSNTTEETPLLYDELEYEPYTHNHTSPAHSHPGSMNMHALILHVIGDALGNVGVIITGLVIWLSHWNFKYYLDPIISLVITIIIFSSALPLVRSASFILLQGVPSSISLDVVRDSILEVEGVLSVHELHVWQLSESKVIASVHVLVLRDHDFMPIAVKIRNALHHHGIHSSTIQPEYLCPDVDPKDFAETPCLVLCPSDQACNPLENACCPPLLV